MIQQYKININPNFTGDCGGPTEPVTGTVEVCPGNPVIRIECYTDLDQCVDNYVEVTIEEQCSCQEGLPFCGGENNTFEFEDKFKVSWKLTDKVRIYNMGEISKIQGKEFYKGKIGLEYTF